MFEVNIINENIQLYNKENGTSETLISFGGTHNNFTNISSSTLLSRFIELFKNYPVIQKYTYGETTVVDILGILSLVFEKLMEGKYHNIRALEVGSWFGCSSYFFAGALKAFSEDNYLFCMDTWEGSPDTESHNIANYENGFEHFRSVMKYGKVYNSIKPIVCDSTLGVQVLQDDFFDIIFVDANHTYNYVFQDVVNAIKKIKVGGLLMGHDCECYADELPLNLLNEDNKNLDCAEGYHTGVIKALHDIFGRSYSRVNHSLIWYKVITQQDKDMVMDTLLSEHSNEKKQIIELSNTMEEAIQYLYNNINGTNSEILYSLMEDMIKGFHTLELLLLPICEKTLNKDLKITTNKLKSYLIDVKMYCDENEIEKAELLMDNVIVGIFNEWVNHFDTAMNEMR